MREFNLFRKGLSELSILSAQRLFEVGFIDLKLSEEDFFKHGIYTLKTFDFNYSLLSKVYTHLKLDETYTEFYLSELIEGIESNANSYLDAQSKDEYAFVFKKFILKQAQNMKFDLEDMTGETIESLLRLLELMTPEEALGSIKRTIARAYSYSQEQGGMPSLQRKNLLLSFLNRLYDRYKIEKWTIYPGIDRWELEEVYGISLAEIDSSKGFWANLIADNKADTLKRIYEFTHFIPSRSEVAHDEISTT